MTAAHFVVAQTRGKQNDAGDAGKDADNRLLVSPFETEDTMEQPGVESEQDETTEEDAEESEEKAAE